MDLHWKKTQARSCYQEHCNCYKITAMLGPNEEEENLEQKRENAVF